MPLGFERRNERQQRPNALINFIKPLNGPDKATSEEFLSRIAAQCYPVMKKHHISVMALEEYEPNPEFLGRNFNAGEVIQLVLKDKQGRWLSMKFVQMVMMHELAHCKQMNHSRFFWAVRNEYAKHMEDLWGDRYTGEGMWGRGRGLTNGAFIDAAPPDNTQIPEHLCGGSYRRRGRKRKRRQDGTEQPEKLTYAERQQRRISRKFGKHGDGASLGEDDMVRGALESMTGGKRGQGKPRVANSKRGRELRAAAALARFEQKKTETPEGTPGMDDDLDSETESEWEDDANSSNDRGTVVISDDRGRDLVKVCGGGEDDEEGAGKEMDELRLLSSAPKGRPVTKQRSQRPSNVPESLVESSTESEDDEARRAQVAGRRHKEKMAPPVADIDDDSETESEPEDNVPEQRSTKDGHDATKTLSASEVELPRELDTSNAVSQPDEETTAAEQTQPPEQLPDALPRPTSTSANVLVCSICSLENEPNTPTCVACSNVLQPKLMPNHWRCKSETCKGSQYINAGDAGRCGICAGPKRKVPALSDASSGRPIGITRAEVLRWE